MKKIAFLAIGVVAFAACCGSKSTVEVDKLVSSIETFNGQTVTFVGKAVVTAPDQVAVYGTDTTKSVLVVANEALVSAVTCGKSVKVTGVVTACTEEEGKYYVAATELEKVCCSKEASEHKCCAKKDSAAQAEVPPPPPALAK
ncbi:hypothetical protein FACS189467_2930 [Bacteroidia bacterium]|nr:hypothetical protein FACS189467_2930 [Bacteroidia bacterium]